MRIIPAIDIIDGECVRLHKGRFDRKKSYSRNPIEVAVKWKEAGAKWLHIVDLDGARCGRTINLGIAQNIKKATGLKVEFGGGIRDIKSLSGVLDSGIDLAIAGTAIIEDAEFFGQALEKYCGRFILSIDFDGEGFIYKHGWQTRTELNVFEYLPLLEKKGLKEIIVTNISRDGTLSGVDAEIIGRLLECSGVKLIIAGGVLNLEDISKLKALEKNGIAGVIIGKALYEGTIDLKDAIKISETGEEQA
jgi:phosphoribosylformimino-5-aminoimidazole carboxamide ribotide isomerase